MFINPGHLCHVLPPEAYYSQEQHDVELDRLFRPSWNLFGRAKDLANDGDFITGDLLGVPVIVRNFSGDLHAFVNVCAHRHCKIRGEEKGNDDALRCQYHGWHYNEHGRTGRIPDAKAFRPFDRENAQLQKLSVDRCGDLVFVRLTDKGPTLREFLGEVWDTVEYSFSAPWQEVYSYEGAVPSNWKIPVENAAETYHLDFLHANTLGEMPAEETVEHVLEDEYSSFVTKTDHHNQKGGMKVAAKALGAPFSGTMHLHTRHPNLMFMLGDMYKKVEVTVPVSPTTSWTSFRIYCHSGRGGLVGGLIAKILTKAVLRFALKVRFEDMEIYEQVQKGIEASPFQGVIGNREERVYAFQQYIATRCRPTQLLAKSV